MKNNPLFDIDFLNQLTLKRERVTFARITALTKDERPIETLEGRITGGTLNIDGASAVRRTCSITMVANDVNINDYYWGLKNKFKLEIGLQNTINPIYPDIIWFKQGLFIITSFTTSQTTNSYTINISGKDKMCLLNGEVAGSLPYSVDFGMEEYLDLETNTTTRNSIPLKTIIREAVQSLGGELAQNIIINDLDEAGLEILEYRGEVPLYLKRKIDEDIFINMTLNGKQPCYIKQEGIFYQTTLDDSNIVYDDLNNLVDQQPTTVYSSSNDNSLKYYIAKLEYGDIAGFRLTDLIYPGDLISNIGESLTSILDKIKNVLGNFEYFYDVNGKFIFQKKQNYVISPWGGNEKDEEVQIKTSENANNQIFNFTQGHLVSSFSNSPNLLNLRNDFAVWGKYKTTNGDEIPIHMRYAVDEKPKSYLPIRPLKKIVRTYKNDELEDEDIKYYNAFDIEPYDESKLREEKTVEKFLLSGDWKIIETSEYYAKEPYTVDQCDWRELIFQMALDYRKFYHSDDFLYNLQQSNPWCLNGKTGYEQYYIDLEKYWRDLYNPNPDFVYTNIDTEEAKTLQQNNKLFLHSYDKIKKENIKNVDDIEDFSNYYILYSFTITTPETSNEEVSYICLYPFIEGYCHLNESETYYCYDNEVLTEIIDSEELKNKSVNDLYIRTDDDKYIKFIKQKFNTALESNLIYSPVEYIKYQDIPEELKELYNMIPESLTYVSLDNFGQAEDLTQINSLPIFYFKQEYDYYLGEKDGEGNLLPLYWKKNALESPENLLFWLDFLETDGTDLARYNIPTIGNRPKAINDDNVKSIYYREIPSTIFQYGNDKQQHTSGYTYVQIQPHMESLFSISSKGKSAKERIDELLYDHLYCTESANISAVPVYHLEPNSRVFIQDEKSKINGEYLINKITIPLAYNGMMTLTTIKTAPSSITQS